MNPWIISIAIFCGIAIAQSFFLGSYLLFKDRQKRASTLFLSLMLFGLALRIGKSYTFYILHDVPLWGVALGAAGLWAIGPSFWLYTLSSKPQEIRKLDILHYLPSALLFTLFWYWPIQVLVQAYHIGAWALAGYIITSLWMFYGGNWNGNRARYQLFGASLSIISFVFLLQMLSDSVEWYAIGSAIASIVLYGVNFFILNDQAVLTLPKMEHKKTDDSSFDQIAADLVQIFKEEKLYRQKGLTLNVVAEQLNYPSYLISKTINQHFGVKFNEFVNKYRVEEVKTRLKDLQSNPKMEALAKDVGFSSTSTFYHAFKKETQVTPQTFRKQILKTN